MFDTLAAWSPWRPFFESASEAPTAPGVYAIRLPAGQIIYVGMAGERRGLGLRDRLAIYRNGRGWTSGFGQAAATHALADPEFLSHQHEAINSGKPRTPEQWARDAIAWWKPELCWATTPDKSAARQLEKHVGAALADHGIWNPQAFVKRTVRAEAGSTSRRLTIDDVAAELDVPPKRIREWARKQGWRTSEERGKPWAFTDEQFAVLRELARR